MRRFEIVRSATDTSTSHAGQALIGRAIQHTRLPKDLATIPFRHGIAHADCVTSYFGLLCTGQSDFDAIENKRNDVFFKTALGLERVPASPSLRQRFDEHAQVMIPMVDTASTDFIANIGAAVTPIVIKYGTCLRRIKRKYVAGYGRLSDGQFRQQEGRRRLHL